jgi:hypothetical protein
LKTAAVWHALKSVNPTVAFDVLTAVSMKTAVFWVIASCSLGRSFPVFQRSLLPPSALMMEAARTSETLINFYQTTRRHNPEDSHLSKPDISASSEFEGIIQFSK